MPVKLYLDDNMAGRTLIGLLRENRFDVVTPTDAGLVGHDDRSHSVYARRHGFVLMTKNPSDFLELHMEDGTHPGIIGIYQDNDVRKDMNHREIVATLRRLVKEGFNFAGKFVVLNQYRTRRKMR